MPRRNPNPWFAALLLLGLAHLGLALPAAESPVDLTGVVTSANGRPLTNASVFIYTAGPRVGVGFL